MDAHTPETTDSINPDDVNQQSNTFYDGKWAKTNYYKIYFSL